jgi:hypothetical protein
MEDGRRLADRFLFATDLFSATEHTETTEIRKKETNIVKTFYR